MRRAPFFAALALAACSDSGNEGSQTASTATAHGPWFEECARAAGLEFVHSAGTQRFWFPEIMGGGAGLLDFDGDGWLDVVFVQSGELGEHGASTQTHKLFRNRRDGTFEDITAAAGLTSDGYGMGVACADYDGDRDTDIYVTQYGANVLYRNDGQGHFTDVTREAGVESGGWSTSACFLDYDRDGDLDLFVAHYVRWNPELERSCVIPTLAEKRDYCPPRTYSAERDVMFENRGDGTFADVTAELGLASADGNGLGVVSADFNADGRPDLFVANDATPNQLWIQDEHGRFEDRALTAGCALGGGGEARAGMGVVAADLEGDGDIDLFLSQLRGEPNTIYVQQGGVFLDRSAALGIAGPSRAFTGFGLGVCDFDNDGRLDVFVANGHVYYEEPLCDPADPYAEPDQVFVGMDGPRFAELEPRGGTAQPLVAAGRGAAFGDLDNDGDVDVVVVNRNARAFLLRNRVGEKRPWIELRILDAGGRDALGAVVTLRSGARTQVRIVQPGSSYLSSNDPRVHFGLGASESVDELRVRWPRGDEESFAGLEARKIHELKEGSGAARSAARDAKK